MPAKPVLVDLDFGGTGRIVNLASPQNPQDAVTKSYVDSLLEGLAWKDEVRVATTSNISITNPPSTIDGVSLSVGDR
ncbi:MAG: hypothetical protein QXS54_02110, partial [Candidatus Methanomethylicaceae archaeon]